MAPGWMAPGWMAPGWMAPELGAPAMECPGLGPPVSGSGSGFAMPGSRYDVMLFIRLDKRNDE